MQCRGKAWVWPGGQARHTLGRVLSNPHMITSFYPTTGTGRWRSNMKSVRLSLPVHLSAFTDTVPQEYILKAKVFMKGKKMGWVRPMFSIHSHIH
jgi:hypothetical protein